MRQVLVNPVCGTLGLAIHQPHQHGPNVSSPKTLANPTIVWRIVPMRFYDLGPLFQQSLQFGMHLYDDLFDVASLPTRNNLQLDPPQSLP